MRELINEDSGGNDRCLRGDLWCTLTGESCEAFCGNPFGGQLMGERDSKAGDRRFSGDSSWARQQNL